MAEVGSNEQQSVVKDDPFGLIKREKSNPAPDPRDVNFFHTRADTDSGTGSMHHTLGTGHNQGSYGDHNHDGSNSRLLAYNRGLTISGAKGGNAAVASIIAMLKNVIDFTDNTTA